MPKLLEESEVDLDAEALDLTMSAAEEAAERAAFAIPAGPVGDLSEGGRVGRVNVFPNPIRDGRGRLNTRGRANARRAWMWDGTETVLPLAWNPEGNRHDGARAFMGKKHCLCCGASGFRGGCLVCVRSGCRGCNAGTDKSKIIPCFYLRQEDVPFPQKFYGDVPCFLPLCPRRGATGFKTEEDMRMHARTRHRMEYAVHQEVINASKQDEIASLKELVNSLLISGVRGSPSIVEAKTPLTMSEERKARSRAYLVKARAAMKAKREARKAKKQ